MDDRWRRKTVGLQSGASAENAQPLLSPLYYVSRALEPYGEMSEPADPEALKAALDQGLSMLVLADIGVLPAETAGSGSPVGGERRRAGALRGAAPCRRTGQPHPGAAARGRTLAGQRTQLGDAAGHAGLPRNQSFCRSCHRSRRAQSPARSWRNPTPNSPTRSGRPRGRHAAGHRRREGKGTVVLFHVTANADWSNLPLSGLFVEMLRRIVDLAPAAGGGTAVRSRRRRCAAGLRTLPQRSTVSATSATPARHPPIPAAQIDSVKASPGTPAGLYRRGGQERAINIMRVG